MAQLEWDLLAGTAYRAAIMTGRARKVLVFDSGLGGLTVLAELAVALPAASFVYAADDAAFPYGALGEFQLIERVLNVMTRLIAVHDPALVVVACNTASTIVLPALRARFSIPFVGTVPAIKPAAEATRSGLLSVIATKGTIQRDYTRALIETYASAADVTLIAAPGLAPLAEAHLKGELVSNEAIHAELAPCFVEKDGRRTDVIVLACTHYPLLIGQFQSLAPWPVIWIDPAPAIARRAADLLDSEKTGPNEKAAASAIAVFTGGGSIARPLRHALATYGLNTIVSETMPLTRH